METKRLFQKLIKTLDSELEAYEMLKELLNEKKEVLKKAKTDDLGEVDNKILALNQRIVKLNDVRKNISMELLGKNGCMSEFIELSRQQNPEFEEALLLRKVKICNNIEQIALVNQQNVALINHGIIITDKMLETIIDVFAPQGSNYNGAGKTDSHDYNMWTVNEEI